MRSILTVDEQIVDDRSGFMGAATDRRVPMQNRDHREICKYGSESDNGFQSILAAIKEGVPKTS